jgi:protein SCO1/2
LLKNWLVYIVILSIASGLTATGEGSLMVPKSMEQAQITDKAGAKIPSDIRFTDHNGQQKTLGDYLAPGLPVITILGYMGCPMLCSLVMNGLVDALKLSKYKLGTDYRMVYASIDHRESYELAAKKRANYIEIMNVSEEQAKAWSFNVMEEGEARRLADALGFGFSYDKKIDQFAHGAGFFVLSPKGILSRTFFGIEFKPADINMALIESADGKIGSFIDKVLLSCFHYDPDSHRYGVYIFGVMRLAGLLTVLILATMLLLYFRNERKSLNQRV